MTHIVEEAGFLIFKDVPSSTLVSLTMIIHIPRSKHAGLEPLLMTSQRRSFGRESHVILAVGESERLAYSPILSCATAARREPEDLGGS